MLEDSEWSCWSDNEIARRCGVSQPFVGKLRPAASYNDYKMDNAALWTADQERKVMRGGTTYMQNTANIGKPAEPKNETVSHLDGDDDGAELRRQ